MCERFWSFSRNHLTLADTGARVCVAVGAYAGGIALIVGGYFDPAAVPALSAASVLGLVLALGLIVGRWAVLPLGAAAGFWASHNLWEPFAATVFVVVGMAAVGLLALVVFVHQRVPARAVRVGRALLALVLLTFVWAGYRQLSPLDVEPSRPWLVDVGRGTAGQLALGESLVVAREHLGPVTDAEAPADSPGFEEHGAITLWFNDQNAITGVELQTRAYQTLDGVGVGDSMEHARRAYGGFVCDRSERGEVECAGRQAAHILMLVGNPIRDMEISSLLCYPALSVDGGTLSRDCPQARHPLTRRRP